MPVRDQIPLLSTHDLWARYVNPDLNLLDYFGNNPEDFLIARLEDTGHLLNVPTAPHRRNVNEVVFVTNGKVVRSSNLNKIEIGTGEFHLTLADQISTVDYLSKNVTGYYCHFSLETIIKLYHKEHMINELGLLNAQMKTSPVLLKNNSFNSVKAIFERLIDEYKTSNEVSLIDAYLVTLCYEVRNAMPKNSFGQRQPRAYDLADQFKQLIVKYIHQHQSISFYAQQLNVTPNHLNKAVRQATGKQASAIISEMLILEAKVLLRHSELPVSEVAFKLGFIDQSYFSRFFKQHTGNTPRQYKTKND